MLLDPTCRAEQRQRFRGNRFTFCLCFCFFEHNTLNENGHTIDKQWQQSKLAVEIVKADQTIARRKSLKSSTDTEASRLFFVSSSSPSAAASPGQLSIRILLPPSICTPLLPPHS